MNSCHVQSRRARVLFAVAVLLPAMGFVRAHAAVLANPDIRLETDLVRLRALTAELVDLESEMRHLQETVGLKTRGHYTATEHDQIESLLFRYLACRESLWEIVNFYRNYKEHFVGDEHQTRAFIIGFNAALKLGHYGSRLVATFLDEPEVIKKLNEPFYRSEIPEGTYDRVFRSVTAVDNIKALRAAWKLFSAEASNPKTALAQIVDRDRTYRELVKEIGNLYGTTDLQIERILEKRSLLLPNVRNQLRHTAVTELVMKTRKLFGNNLYAARGVLFVNISRLKMPTVELVTFSEKQRKELIAELQPGDIILTFTAGYMSNIFLPGQFKHGITYVGSPKDRNNAGLDRNAPGITWRHRRQFRKNIRQSELSSGKEADVIEAVAEGVIFNSLDHLLRTHVNRLAVIRPRLGAADRVQALATTFSLLGSRYDFKFDFNDASYQCCTEVIYRALYSRGSIALPLTERMGRQTLSADDIVQYHIATEQRCFELMLLAEEDPDSTRHEARILLGEEGETRLREIMAGAGED